MYIQQHLIISKEEGGTLTWIVKGGSVKTDQEVCWTLINSGSNYYVRCLLIRSSVSKGMMVHKKVRRQRTERTVWLEQRFSSGK